MNWSLVVGRAGAASALAGCLALAGSPAVRAGLDWSQVPPTTPLSVIRSVSCPSAAECVAGGYYTDRVGHQQAFVVSQVRGRWGKPIALTGPLDLNPGGSASVESVSCASAGNCAAGGLTNGRGRPLVVSEVNGRWGAATEVPGIGALGDAGGAWVTSVSCGAPGYCSAVGDYQTAVGVSGDPPSNQQGFVVDEVNGVWGTAQEIPGLGALNVFNVAMVTAVSCASAGNCSAGGSYYGHAITQGFVVNQAHGAWGTAQPVPGLETINTLDNAQVSSLSCTAPGSCGATGYYEVIPEDLQAFAASEVNGSWGTVQDVSRAPLRRYHHTVLTALSCSSPGNCAAGGWYSVRLDAETQQGLVMSEARGRWGPALEVPGLAALNQAVRGTVTAVKCYSRGGCVAVGYYSTRSAVEPFVVSEVNGRWGAAIEVPGIGALNTGRIARLTTVSCSPRGYCTAAGFYRDRLSRHHAFVVTESAGRWGAARRVF